MARYEHEAWAEGLTTMNECCGCRSQTKSHSVYAHFNEDAATFAPASPDDYDYQFAVCHSCFQEYDDPADLLEGYNREVETTAHDSATASSIHGSLKQYDNAEYGRGTTYVGEQEVAKAIEEDARLGNGDLLTINGDGPWLIVDTDPTQRDSLPGDVLHGLVKNPRGEALGGGLMASDNPFDDRYFHTYQNRQTKEVEFEPIEQLEVHEKQG